MIWMSCPKVSKSWSIWIQCVRCNRTKLWCLGLTLVGCQRVCIVYICVDVDTYDIDRLKWISMAANIVCAPVPWAWTYPGWPPPLDLLGTCGWGSPAHQSTHSNKTTWRPFLFNQSCPIKFSCLTNILVPQKFPSENISQIHFFYNFWFPLRKCESTRVWYQPSWCTT